MVRLRNVFLESTDNNRSLEARLKAIEDCLRRKGFAMYGVLPTSPKCGSKLPKGELLHLFYLLMDEGVWFFNPADRKKNRRIFQDFIQENFTYRGEGGSQHSVAGVSRHFSECTGFTYREKQLMHLEKIIRLLIARRERLERK